MIADPDLYFRPQSRWSAINGEVGLFRSWRPLDLRWFMHGWEYGVVTSPQVDEPNSAEDRATAPSIPPCSHTRTEFKIWLDEDVCICGARRRGHPGAEWYREASAIDRRPIPQGDGADR